MAAKQATKRKPPKPPAAQAGDGWHDVPDEAPQALDLEVGESIEGTVGPVRAGKYNRYRILTTRAESSKGSHEPGRFYLQGASLESLMDYPVGSSVRLKFMGELDVGKGNAMRNYKKQVKPAESAPATNDQDDLPF